MINGIYYAHSGWRYVVILVAVLAIAKMLIGWFGNGKWSSLDRALGTVYPITLDIQFLLGLVLWIMQQRWTGASALSSWEHPVTMIISLAIAHIGWTRAKKGTTDREKYQTAAIWFIISGLVLALGIARITYVI